jgi:hypothetical protein
MPDDIFEVDPRALVVTFPCFILTSGVPPGFFCHEIDDGGKAVAILTDDDLLDRYRREMGLDDRPALQFDSAAELLSRLRKLPEAITHVVVDPPQRFRESQVVRSFLIGAFKKRLGRSIDSDG